MDFTTCYCPYPQCMHYGQRGFGAHLVHCGADRGIPRLLCTMCQGTFSVRQGTAYFKVRGEEPNDTIAMRALAEGNSLRGTGRIVDVDKDTVCDWLDRAGRHCRAVTTYLFDTLPITECQVDELWSFVRKKEAHLTVAEKILTLYGDAWVWIAFAPTWRLVAAFGVGKRDQKHANLLLDRLHAVRCGYIPFLPVISCRTMRMPYCMCMAYQRLSCTFQANVVPSPNPSFSHLLTCIMLKLSSIGKAGA
jgi:transposase-like protein